MSISTVITGEEYEKLQGILQNIYTDSLQNGVIYRGIYDKAYFTVFKNKHGRLTLVVNGKDYANAYKKVYPHISGRKVSEGDTLSYNGVSNNVTTIGYDEVAVGSLIGGIYSACVLVPEGKIQLLMNAGVKDSKKLSDSRVLELSRLIEEHCSYFTFNFTPTMYNARVGKGLRYNSNSVKSMIADYTVKSLLDKVLKVEDTSIPIIVDAFVSKELHLEYMKKSVVKDYYDSDNFIFIEGADDKFTSVACASILARKLQLEELGSLSQTYLDGRPLPIGASTKVDAFIKDVISMGILKREDIPHLVKCNFNNLIKCGLPEFKQ